MRMYNQPQKAVINVLLYCNQKLSESFVIQRPQITSVNCNLNNNKLQNKSKSKKQKQFAKLNKFKLYLSLIKEMP